MPECSCRNCGKKFEAPVRHRLLVGDSRNPGDIERLFAGAKANVVITSPPYASQRKYDESSGFKPIHPDEYVVWFEAVAKAIKSVLAPDGSYFLNIKAHADAGERSLYVMDLVLAHKRKWSWRFIDEFCWRKTDNGVPGGWPNRFKNAFEPVFHFTQNHKIKFNATGSGTHSSDCFDSGGKMGVAQSGMGRARKDADKSHSDSRYDGLARPSNVLDIKSETAQGAHAAPFPRALVEFFVKAFSDAGDVIFDPFMGGGTSMAAAHVLKRSGYGIEISPGYADVIILRLVALGAGPITLEGDGRTFEEVKAARASQSETDTTTAIA